MNLICPINNLGYGITSLNILRAAIRAGHKVALWPIGQADAPTKDHDSLREAVENTKFFDRLAPCLRIWHQFDLAQMVGKGLHAALPIFELDHFTQAERHHLNSVDVVFTPSKWGADVLANNGVSATHVTPLGVDTSLFNEVPPSIAIDEFEPSTPDTTVFLNIGKWEVRKGHDVLVQAFNAAFNTKDNVSLVMNCHNPFIGAQNDEWARAYLNSRLGRDGKITVFKQRLPEQENVAALIHKCDVGVFPARAEGWNLDLLEMMACGKCVIATNYAAHTEYCNNNNTFLVHTDKLEPAHDGLWFYGQGNWAAIGANQKEQLVEHMRQAHRLKQGGNLQKNVAGMETAKQFTWDRTFEKISHILYD